MGVWLIEVYKGSPKCLGDTWTALVESLSQLTTGGEANTGQAVYTIPLPSSLANNGQWKEQKFKVHSPRVSPTPAPDKTTTDGLLRVLLTALNRNFMTGLNPEILLATENIKCKDAKETITHLVLVGASHLKRTIPHFKRLGYTVIDVTCPGRAVSPAGVAKALNQLKGVKVPATSVVVFDLFGNSSYRWEGEDGTLSMSVKTGNGYHMPGAVTVCSLSLIHI